MNRPRLALGKIDHLSLNAAIIRSRPVNVGVSTRYDNITDIHTYVLPGISPTGTRVEPSHVVVTKFENGKVAHEHIWWDVTPRGNWLRSIRRLERVQDSAEAVSSGG